MNKLLFALILLAFPASAQLSISDPISVSGEFTGSIGPKIALDAAQNPIVFWGDIDLGSNKMYTANSSSGVFNAPLQLSIGSDNPFVNSVEGPMMASHGDTVYIAFQYFSAPSGYLLRSTDGGESWTPPIQFSLAGDNVVLVSVSTRDDGNPVAAYLHNEGGGIYSYKVVRSSDLGDSWTSPTDASANSISGVVCECCPASLMASGDSIFLLFRNNNSNVRDSWLSRSTDGGVSFPDAVDIDGTDWIINGCPATGPDGVLGAENITSTFMSAGSGSGKVYAVEVNRDDLSASTELLIRDEPGSTQRYPYLAGSDDQLGVVWSQTRPGQVSRVYLAWSASGVAGLPDNVIALSDTTIGANYPDIAWDGQAYHIVYASSGQVWYKKVEFINSGVSMPIFELDIYPNPTSDYIHLNVEGSFELYSINGALVKTGKIEGGKIDVTTVSGGEYLLYVNDSVRRYSAVVQIK